MPEVLLETTAELLRFLIRHDFGLQQSGQPFLHETHVALIQETLRSVEPAVAVLEGDARVRTARVQEVLGFVHSTKGVMSPVEKSGL
jgi:hypothetical protein